MSTLKGVNRTKADSPSGANIADPGVLGGNVKTMIDYYEMDGTEVALDIIELAKRLPKGARMLEAIVLTEKLADTCTLHLGDKEDPDRYISSQDATTPTIVRLGEALTDDSLGYEMDESVAATLDTEVILTLATLAASIVSAARVTVVLMYTHE